ncbi:hypothetical protein KM043_008370 [Ampulex compressa]|nr:hypothetical protein KM043_008370 [Ampulex compressa]
MVHPASRATYTHAEVKPPRKLRPPQPPTFESHWKAKPRSLGTSSPELGLRWVRPGLDYLSDGKYFGGGPTEVTTGCMLEANLKGTLADGVLGIVAFQAVTKLHKAVVYFDLY